MCGLDIEEFTDDMECCPNCKTTSVPCTYDNQVDITINWHELRILCMWAERYALEHTEGAGVVYSIAERIRMQYPNKSALTLSEELGEIEDMFGKNNVETNFPGME